MLHRFYFHLRSLWCWRRQDAELDEEIRFHLAEEADERMAGGLSPEDARLAARREFGNVTLVRELTRAPGAGVQPSASGAIFGSADGCSHAVGD